MAGARLWKHLRHLCLAAGPCCALGCGATMSRNLDYDQLAPSMPAAMTKVTPQPALATSQVQQISLLEVQGDKPLPITLDTVLRLAEEHSPRVRLAREKLHECELDGSGGQIWMPTITAGVGYFRHEGGIQDFQGNLVHSSYGSLFPGVDIQTEIDIREATFRQIDGERKIWQQKGDLSKTTSETLVDSANAYLDLLLAQRAEFVDIELERLQLGVLKVAESIYKTDKQAEILVETTQAEISQRRQGMSLIRQQAAGAGANLAYLLGLGPNAKPVPMDKLMAPIDLVDASPPAEELVARALANGPGVHELESLLNTVQHGIDQSQGITRLLPVIHLGVVEGAFGAGPGSNLSFDNRLDLGLTARWNLTDFLNSNCRRGKAESQRQQAELTLEDLRGGLAAKVREAREAIVHGREQISHLTEQVQHASNVYRLSKRRFDEDRRQYFSEILQSIRLLEQAHLQYLKAINDYNKAQVRLLVLLGTNGKDCKQ